MSKPSKSQWDFGDLFSAESSRQVLTVSELTTEVKRLLENELGRLWVSGEITNLRVQGSGHVYFTLKDATSQVNCVFFRGGPTAGRQLLEDGRKVLLQGDLTVYEPRGQYQVIVRAVELQGIGALQIAFERLKQKLDAEGLFSADRKRPLPGCPRGIGLVTSPTGAAVRDVLHVIQRRDPGLKIILAPCRVQGDGAAPEIAKAIRLLNEWSATTPGTLRPVEGGIDLILVTRGGGSLEDLWAFNEEVVARAVFESSLPVVSAVGHEIDFTICDFVADLRAATPSAAAEIVTEGVFASREFIAGLPDWMRQLIRRRLAREVERVAALTSRGARAHPRRRLNEQLQRLDDLQTSMWRVIRYRRRDCQIAWRAAHQQFLRLRPAQHLLRSRQRMGELDRRLHEQRRRHLKSLQDRVTTLEARLRLLSPAGVLDRGYSITMDAITGKVIRNAGDAAEGRLLRTRVKHGEIRSVVESSGLKPSV